MAARLDFRSELPVADVDLGGHSYVRVYGFPDITPVLVEMRIVDRGQPEMILNLLPDQAEKLAAALGLAAINARGA